MQDFEESSFNGRLGIAIANSFISSSPDWRKVVFLGAILAGLINQLSWDSYCQEA